MAGDLLYLQLRGGLGSDLLSCLLNIWIDLLRSWINKAVLSSALLKGFFLSSSCLINHVKLLPIALTSEFVADFCFSRLCYAVLQYQGTANVNGAIFYNFREALLGCYIESVFTAVLLSQSHEFHNLQYQGTTNVNGAIFYNFREALLQALLGCYIESVFTTAMLRPSPSLHSRHISVFALLLSLTLSSLMMAVPQQFDGCKAMFYCVTFLEKH
ncbi:hypothetical protein ACFE04_006527 [Oxalis oulophora]